ncbi:MAG: metallophosphoesterase [Coriobacteriaceae bacterium]|jgi:hypothetical protein|nr:metallophosphoesterase [Coriobacteriaceae bacterium]
MTRVLLVGDLHTKTNLLPTIESAGKQHNVDRIVLLGDYLDDWDMYGVRNVRSLRAIVDWARENKNVTLLLGNHDMGYLYTDRRHSGYDYTIEDPASNILYNNRDLFSVADWAGNWLFTHAGLCAEWAHEVAGMSDNLSAKELSERLNSMLPDEGRLDQLRMVSASRGGREPSPGVVWADQRDLLADPYRGVNQVVGHTPQETCTAYTFSETDLAEDVDSIFGEVADGEDIDAEAGAEAADTEASAEAEADVKPTNAKPEAVDAPKEKHSEIIVFCDTFSTRRHGEAIGDKSMLLLDSENDTLYRVLGEEIEEIEKRSTSWIGRD